ncbi:MAG: hypothetical protein A3G34_04265 [Candidatus Lindowbacteria bacterium RIFCSPLOWO2_12_FULL_62_27]|nr:MAG: hypothetical protein A3G34_04265 [Candidatus Lindowbacteria bacterium RIFCSPLOWO2_12_FULL_62_27]OGH63781.1 MAG: hypothetical protein A3I06_12730 [Candidatus Lindowbacteria bacterium RIFCSPLOWO2_02_FULL_62_12]
MNVVVDTCVWSTAFRPVLKPELKDVVNELKELIGERRVVLLGPIRQEVLSGVRKQEQFEALKEHLKPFEDFPLTSEDYEYAAELFNMFRSKGLQGSNADFLIVAVSMKHDLSVFSTDKDFKLYMKHLKFHLHEIRKQSYPGTNV